MQLFSCWLEFYIKISEIIPFLFHPQGDLQSVNAKKNCIQNFTES